MSNFETISPLDLTEVTTGETNVIVAFDSVTGEPRKQTVDDNLDTRVTDNKNDIATNTSDISDNANNIATNTSNIANNTSDISGKLNKTEIIGTIIAYANNSVLPGFLECDGSAISRTTYSDLFSAIGTTWGAGDGSTTFNLPDLQGAYLRGVGTSTIFTQDKTIAIAEILNDAMQGHWHNIASSSNVVSSFTAYNSSGASQLTLSGGSGVAQWSFSIKNPIADNTNGTPRTDNETRVNSVGVKMLIKY